jgi:hypothetical protein
MAAEPVRDIERSLVERCLAAIRSYAPDHGSVQGSDAFSMEHDGQRWVYINDPPRDDCGVDEIYLTFIVQFDRATDELLRVIHYRSRKGTRGDETLPPP